MCTWLCEVAMCRVYLRHTAPRTAQQLSHWEHTPRGVRVVVRRLQEGRELRLVTQRVQVRSWDMNSGGPVPKAVYLHRSFDRHQKKYSRNNLKMIPQILSTSNHSCILDDRSVTVESQRPALCPGWARATPPWRRAVLLGGRGTDSQKASRSSTVWHRGHSTVGEDASLLLWGGLLKPDVGPQALYTGCVNMLGSTFPMEGPGWGTQEEVLRKVLGRRKPIPASVVRHCGQSLGGLFCSGIASHSGWMCIQATVQAWEPALPCPTGWAEKQLLYPPSLPPFPAGVTFGGCRDQGPEQTTSLLETWFPH